ncbi:glycoside hydrolase family 66 protein [Anaerocolumna xylanovorans]|uniref:Dextranase n=1 Tax=Anaerocolumna xylanovorans DSM 12503 TaxID=1121345 RepID=A0A1M7XZ55_9FIRM|nr:glycoside hydrolase family 66 protein [Anaerocolumna xylanovorans]SHO44454.1 dextranase [Anaerocolumna xylanovorans DSM 12503]
MTDRYKRYIAIVSIVFVLLLSGTVIFFYVSGERKAAKAMEIENITTDKSRYYPGDKVKITVYIKNTNKSAVNNTAVKLKAFHLGEETGEEKKLSISSLPSGEKTIDLVWQAPEKDYTGYLLELSLSGKWGGAVSYGTVGVDVSSTVLKFPRYGYLSDFSQGADTKSMIQAMTEYHINTIEYYDWQYLHHQPLADGITAENPGVWKDWSGREIYGTAIADYIKYAHEANMINMAYNMIYAGTDTFFWDKEGKPTIAEQWKLYFAPDSDRGEGEFKFHMGTSPSGNGNLYFLNPLNPSWQKYIFAQENKIFKAFAFDGWHGDTVGDWGKMVTYDGKPLGVNEAGEPIYLVKDTYTRFLNAAKEALGNKYLSFNPVGAQGIENANKSKTDILYAEFWPWDKDREGNTYDTYYSLAKEVERSFTDSKPESFDGKGKSLVVKAYINYDKTVGNMNDPGVILAAASVYAAGGSRLEIGNGDHMLHKEYYPDDNIPMSGALKKYMKGLFDFTVAYENILRDGQMPVENDVTVEGYNTSRDGKSDTLWTYTKTDGTYDVLHLINLLGTDNKWRDERGKKSAPKEISDIKVRYYTEKEVSDACLASPDRDGGRSSKLRLTKGKDDKGSFVEFNVPELTYWDMIYMK